MEKSFTNITGKEKQIIKSIGPLLVVVVLFIFVGKFGISQISKLQSKIKETEKKRATLVQKLNILNSISQESAEWADLTVYALPRSNPSLQLLSQLRTVSSNNNVVLTSVKVSPGGGGESNLKTIGSSFSVLGTKESIVAFCNGISQIAPMTLISNINLTDEAGMTKADITARTFYADLPKTIPSVTQAVTDLSTSEKEIINQVSALSQPIISETFTSSTEGINSSPFGE